MKRIIILTFFACMFGGMAKAQTLDSKFGLDSAQTIINTSIYSEYFKHKNYMEALPAWRYVFNNAPFFQLNTYMRGVEIISNVQRTTKNPAYIDTLMMVYDQWIKYFGGDARFGEGYVLGRKGADLYRLRSNDPASVKEAYSYLVKSFEMEQAKTHPLTARITFVVADDLYKKGEISKEEFINLYSKLAAYAKNGTEKARDEKNKETYKEAAATIDAIFFNSGVADCETLNKLLTEKYNQNPNDQAELNSIMRLLKRGECTDLPLYATLAEAIYKAEPNAEAAYNLAMMFFRRNEYDKTEAYLKEAIEKGTNDEEKAEYYLRFAQIKLAQKNFQDVKRNAVEATKLNPNLGQAYILIGQAYAYSSKSYGEDEFEHATVFWAAVDQFNKAKQADPSLTEQVNELIKTYSPHFPSKDEAFFRGIKEGESMKIGSWINETTKVRFR